MNRIATITVGLLALAVGMAFAAPANGASTVTMSGNALRATLGEGLSIHAAKAEGATVYIAEKPELSTVTDAEGFWSLEVPDGAKITPCIELSDIHPMCDQTFYTSGQELRMVNFQTVSEQISDLLATFSDASTIMKPNGHRRLRDCGIVSTIYRWDKRFPADYDELLGNPPHGVAGATATLTSTKTGEVVSEPIYYSEQVIPSKLLTESSGDGGVMWVDLPPGEYTLTASKAGARFSPVQVTCEKGRLVNANPVWGLYQLAPTEEPNPAVYPAPADDSLRAWVRSAKVVKKGPRKRILKLRVLAKEKVRVSVVARQGKRQVRNNRRINPGTRTIKFAIPPAFRQGGLNLNVSLRDSAGNTAASSSRLFVPKVKAKTKKPGRGSARARR